MAIIDVVRRDTYEKMSSDEILYDFDNFVIQYFSEDSGITACESDPL